MLNRRTENDLKKHPTPPQSKDGSVDRSELFKLFDSRYGSLDNSSILSHEEYIKHRDFLIDSGLFSFQLSQFSHS